MNINLKFIFEKPSANVMLVGAKLETFSPKSGTRQECPLSSLLFNTGLDVLGMVRDQQKNYSVSTLEEKR